MSKKPINWSLISKLIFSVIAISFAFLIVFCVNNPKSELALSAYKFIGEPVSYVHLMWILGIYFIWAFLSSFIRDSYEKYNLKKQSKNKATLPEMRVYAKIVTKNSVTNSYHPDLLEYVYVYDNLTITFETQDGKRLVFPVTQEQYSLYLENDTGILSYKECDGQLIFINFERQAQPSN